ncbi:hypothetical protein CHS0354_026815 [Potamilus streckersoni]|uniref:DNA-directed DNA polymerase n=1 Tax=Potamilus streckersoni TaxID=2493646 RepID=A0AAE0T592_9BIVA|nr:hypothetical protein CHS0354_026815 [Potamilus streckersoni]
MSSRFVHLHLHTQYSLMEGLIAVKKLPSALRAREFDACAITDSGNMFGAIEFYGEMKAAGLKPVIGTQIYMPMRVLPNARPHEPVYSEAVLLCRNRQGYNNLLKISSRSYTEGLVYSVPTVTDKMLEEHSEGLIMLSGGLKSRINKLLAEGDTDEALQETEYYRSVFGDYFFLELQLSGAERDDLLNRELLRLADKLGIPATATNNCTYLTADKAFAAHILHLMGEQKKITDPGCEKPDTNQFYLKTASEMAETFRGYPEECLTNSGYIADMCEVNLDKQKDYLPDYPCEAGKTIEEQFKQDCEVGLDIRLQKLTGIYGWQPEQQTEKRRIYFERLHYETEIINNMGYPGYYLIVADFVKWAKANGVSVGPGRGSGPGSIAAYALMITDVDPVRYGLLFERFLNPARRSMPDFDIDFEANGRDRVIEYVRQKYGNDHVCQISAIGSLQAKGAVRGVARVLGIGYSDADRIVKLIPNDLKITLQTAFEKEPLLRNMLENGREIERQLLHISTEVEGMGSNLTTHAAGVIIMNSDVTDYLPVCVSPQGVRQSQYTMEYAEKQGAVKFDFLGLKNLSIIDDTLALLRKAGKPVPDITGLNFDDPAVFELLQQGSGTGIFQLESSGMRRLLRQLKPNCFEDIAALNALYRPGPLGSGMVDDYINRKHGRREISYLHPSMAEVLEETQGVILYQEQVMKVAQLMGGFSLGQADELRRAIGKKKADLLAQQKGIFVEGCLKNGVKQEIAEEVFDLIDKFAGYGFNKSHSVAYAVIGFQTAYLKAHYPTEFMCALMTSAAGSPQDMARLVRECRAMRIQVLPPDINESQLYFTAENGAAVGEGAVQHVLDYRNLHGKYKSLTDALSHADHVINGIAFEAMIKSGTLDSLCKNRRQLFENIHLLQSFISGVIHTSSEDQFALLGEDELKNSLAIDLPDVLDWDVSTRLLNEKNALGFTVSGHLLDSVAAEAEDISGILDFSRIEQHTAGLSPGERSPDMLFLCVISSFSIKMNKSGAKFAVTVLEDTLGEMEGVIWSSAFEETAHLLRTDAPMIVRGQITADAEAFKMIITGIIPFKKYRLDYARGIYIQTDQLPEALLHELSQQFTDPAGDLRLIIRNKTDDGAVIYMDTRVALMRTEEMLNCLEKYLTPEKYRFIYRKNEIARIHSEDMKPARAGIKSAKPDSDTTHKREVDVPSPEDDDVDFILVTDMPLSWRAEYIAPDVAGDDNADNISGSQGEDTTENSKYAENIEPETEEVTAE